MQPQCSESPLTGDLSRVEKKIVRSALKPWSNKKKRNIQHFREINKNLSRLTHKCTDPEIRLRQKQFHFEIRIAILDVK